MDKGHSSQSDIDEIEGLFNASVEPATLEATPSGSVPPAYQPPPSTKTAPQQSKPHQSVPLLPTGANASHIGGDPGTVTSADAAESAFGAAPGYSTLTGRIHKLE